MTPCRVAGKVPHLEIAVGYGVVENTGQAAGAAADFEHAATARSHAAIYSALCHHRGHVLNDLGLYAGLVFVALEAGGKALAYTLFVEDEVVDITL